jgi:outer membrane protein OmpA-like peptidoglycan-associated protein/tetratricopeptide (TPR) repeat protein
MKTKFVFILLLISFAAKAQDIPFDKSVFPNDKDGLRDAKANIKEGDRIYLAGNSSYYNLAIPFYESAHQFNPNNAEINYKLGECYLYSPYKLRSLEFIKRSYELNPQYNSSSVHFLLARGYHLNGMWDEAVREYKMQLELLRQSKGNQQDMDALSKYIEEVNHGKLLTQSKERVWIDNLGLNVNSAAPEYAPLISTDESLLIITARRSDAVGGLKDEVDNLPYEDIYYSRNKAGTWTPLANIGETINGSGHDASSGLSPDGKTLFVFKGSNNGNGDIYISQLVNGFWTKPKALGKHINTSAHETSAALSYDGNELYFISDRDGGQGGKDIYMSRWDAIKQDWGSAVNLGPVVNSVHDEDGVYLHPDGKTMYFSSKGHNTMGGNDIFYTEKRDGQWQRPVNIGHPINTPDDDIFFVVAADGRTAYYASIREDGYGDKDIYRITFLGPEKQPVLNVEEQLMVGSDDKIIEVPLQPEVKIRTSRMILLKGIVIDDETGEPVQAAIDLIDNKTSGVIATFQSDVSSGNYLVMLPAGRNYGLNVNADKYLFNSMNFDIPDTAVYKEFYKVIRLKRIKIGETIVLRNIFFDYNAFTIRQESEAELERLQQLILENPQIKVEISGHTDNVGGDQYNEELSENRAKAVVDYLVAKGVPPDQLIYAGYGKSQPIASNDTPEGRQENRRTEFKIIE